MPPAESNSYLLYVNLLMQRRTKIDEENQDSVKQDAQKRPFIHITITTSSVTIFKSKTVHKKLKFQAQTSPIGLSSSID